MENTTLKVTLTDVQDAMAIDDVNARYDRLVALAKLEAENTLVRPEMRDEIARQVEMSEDLQMAGFVATVAANLSNLISLSVTKRQLEEARAQVSDEQIKARQAQNARAQVINNMVTLDGDDIYIAISKEQAKRALDGNGDIDSDLEENEELRDLLVTEYNVVHRVIFIIEQTVEAMSENEATDIATERLQDNLKYQIDIDYPDYLELDDCYEN